MAERKKVLLRLDPAVYEAIARWAADDLRSVNAQLEYALRLALRAMGREPRAARPGNTDDADDSGTPGNAGAPDTSSD
ncbi:hypothetical protein FHS43_000433 [Streptosporangium becharense]|uniref:Toxin-antitoxin system HicB family antitoxin n=1 Tax=Streptosporangium becharense TaxID=1816182 RepID=A0A7W9MGU5_9ACTN|nr:hypothetical protein [Streptosporangium becharense]MBB2909187.1 hypothetical protein [Streptosporangium becharense]MBB5819794.1 hypothetical protein [Streptosporangium becharense]